jgi:hypothetical protein
MSLPTSNFRRLGAAPEPRKILDLNSKDFDDTVKHFGLRFFQLGAVSDVNTQHAMAGHMTTPVTIHRVPHPNASATEIIAQQRSLTGKIPSLARGVIIAWALFNLTGLILALVGIT